MDNHSSSSFIIMAGRLVDIVLGAAEDNVEWTVCKGHETSDASTQTNKEGDGSELRSIVYKMVHGSTTFQLLEEHGDAFVANYANVMSLATKVRLDAYQHMKLKAGKEKEQKEQKQKNKNKKNKKNEKMKKENKKKEKKKEKKKKKEKEKNENIKEVKGKDSKWTKRKG